MAGWIELHRAIQRWQWDRVPALITEEACRGRGPVAGERGARELPLHLALAEPRVPPKVALRLLTANPAAAMEPDRFGRLPLYLACMSALPLEVVDRVLQAHPAAAAARSTQSQLPLHAALCHPCSCARVVERLLQAHPPPQRHHLRAKWWMPPVTCPCTWPSAMARLRYEDNHTG
jgi:hypothetical protein